MKRLLIAFLLLCVSVWAAPTHVQSKSATTGGTATSLDIVFDSNNTAGNSIIVAVRVDVTARTFTITDTRNTYSGTPDIASADANAPLKIFHVDNIGAGANTVHVAISGGACHIAAAIHEVSGLLSSGSLDKTKTGAGNSAANVTTGAASATSQASEFLFGAVSNNAAQTSTTADAPWTGSEQQDAANSVLLMTEYQIVSATGAYSSDFSNAGNTNWNCNLATYKAGPTFKVWQMHRNRLLRN